MELSLNGLANRLQAAMLARHPEWSSHVEELRGGDIELAIPAPRASRAKHLIVSTSRGVDLWVRFSPPYMAYSADSEEELVRVVEAIIRDRAFFMVVAAGDERVETTLLRPGEEPVLRPGQVAEVVSWSGLCDRTVAHIDSAPTGSDGGA
jgi:hypothetical protein